MDANRTQRRTAAKQKDSPMTSVSGLDGKVAYLEPVQTGRLVTTRAQAEMLQACALDIYDKRQPYTDPSERPVLKGIYESQGEGGNAGTPFRGIVADARYGYHDGRREYANVVKSVCIMFPEALVGGAWVPVDSHLWIFMDKVAGTDSRVSRDVCIGDTLEFLATAGRYRNGTERYGIAYWSPTGAELRYRHGRKVRNVPRGLVQRACLFTFSHKGGGIEAGAALRRDIEADKAYLRSLNAGDVLLVSKAKEACSCN